MSTALLRSLIREVLHQKAEVVVYHASPQLGLQRLMPRYSPKFGEKGVFVSDSLESMWRSWNSWALQKPDKTRSGRTSKLFEKIAVYTIRIPKDVFEEAKKRHATAADAAPDDSGAWGWDIETFVPEDLMPDGYLTPSSVKTYTKPEVEDIELHREKWKSAGEKPGESEVPGGAKNPAKEVLRSLKDRSETAALQRGGRIGAPIGAKTDPQVELKKVMAQIEALAMKSRITPTEEDELARLSDKAEEIMSIPIKSVSDPQSLIPSYDKVRSKRSKERHLHRGQREDT